MARVHLFAHQAAPLLVEDAQMLAGESALEVDIEGLAYHFNSHYAVSEQALAMRRCDVVVQPDSHMPKRLLISDMDSTMITVECIDELADFVGKKAHVAAITERAMRGELDFETALMERVALLKGLPEATLEQCFRERVVMMEGAKRLVEAFVKRGGYTVLVSGGFTFFTARVASMLGFHEHQGNRLEVDAGVLTGRVIAPILGKEAKLATMLEVMKTQGISREEVLAIGDGANDLPMLKGAGLGVAFRAKPQVQAEANARLNFASLEVLQYC